MKEDKRHAKRAPTRARKRAPTRESKPRIDDGEVLVARWRKVDRGYSIVVEQLNGLEVSAGTLQAAIDELEVAIIDQTDGAEVAIEYDPPVVPNTAGEETSSNRTEVVPPTGVRIACSWHERTDGKTEVWVASQRRMAAAQYTWDAADEELGTIIERRLKLRNAERVYDPPPPAPWPPRIDEEMIGLQRDRLWVTLAGNKRARVQDMASLFDGGLCGACRQPIGARNEEPMRVSGAGATVDSFLVEGTGSQRGYWTSIFSGKFIAALTERERASLSLRAVRVSGRGSMDYHEVLSGAREAPLASLPGVPTTQCDACGRLPDYTNIVLSMRNDGELPTRYVSAGRLPANQTVFAVGTPPFVRIALSRERWRQLSNSGVARGIISAPLGVLRTP